MKHKNTDINIFNKQQDYIQDMERYIAVLEQENRQQKEMIELLEEHNRVLQKSYNDLFRMVQRITGEE